MLLISVAAYAAPFVRCNPLPINLPVDGYKIQIDGGAWIDVGKPTDVDVNGQIKLLDLASLNLTNGDHTGKVLAYNIWGDGEVSPFSFTKSAPMAVTGITLSKQ